MSATYTDLTETNFPESVDNFMRMSDIASEDLTLINQYYTYLNAGNLSSAATLLYNNPSLQPKIFNAAKFNRLIDGVVAVQRFFKDDVDGYIEEKQEEFNQTIESSSEQVQAEFNEALEDFKYVGEWNEIDEYKVKNIVTAHRGSFICLVKNVNEPPVEGTDTLYWGVIATKGQQGASGIGLSPKGEWTASLDCYIDDCVSWKNALWQCLNDNIDSEPSDDNLNWFKLLSTETDILEAHISNKENPHQVTALQIGAIPVSNKGVPNGVAPLNSEGIIDEGFLPMVGGFVAQPTEPSNTKLLWVDTAVGGVLKYYYNSVWTPVLSVWHQGS